MKKKILYCTAIDPYGPRPEVVVTFNDGTTDVRHPGDKGYKSARANALRRKPHERIITGVFIK